MTLGLTVYSFVTSDDITYIIGFLFILVSVSFFVGIISIFKWNPFLHNFYIGIAVVIFGIFLLLDTKLLMGGKTYKLFVDDYIIAAMILYMDIIMIFLYLLRLLGGR
jgi:FtsH-binding integral membrane protein